jgi:O-antigen/teichoic acid export membrane protein
LVVLPKGLYTSLFRGRQMMVLNNAIDVGAAVVQQAGILLVLLGGGRVYWVAAWMSASALLGAIAYVFTAARLFGWQPLAPSFSMDVVRRNLGYTGQMMAISLMSLVHVQAAQVIVSKLLPIAEFGFYSLASSTVNRATFVTGAAAQAAFPSFSNLFAAGDRPGLMQQYRKLHELVCYGTLPLFAGICFVALPVFTYVLNAGVAQRLLLPTAFLALGSWMSATLNMPHMLALAMGRPDIAVRTTSLALIVVLPVTVLLILRFGLPGAGFSWVFYHAFVYVSLIPPICRECLQIRARVWYGQIARVAALAAATYGLAWVALVIPFGYSLPTLVVAYLIASVAFLIGALILIGPDLRSTLRRLQAQMLPALKLRA